MRMIAPALLASSLLVGCSSVPPCDRPFIVEEVERLVRLHLISHPEILRLPEVRSYAAYDERTFKTEDIRDRGAQFNGRRCAALVLVSAPMAKFPDRLAVDYLIEPSAGGGVIVSMSARSAW